MITFASVEYVLQCYYLSKVSVCPSICHNRLSSTCIDRHHSSTNGINQEVLLFMQTKYAINWTFRVYSSLICFNVLYIVFYSGKTVFLCMISAHFGQMKIMMFLPPRIHFEAELWSIINLILFTLTLLKINYKNRAQMLARFCNLNPFSLSDTTPVYFGQMRCQIGKKNIVNWSQWTQTGECQFFSSILPLMFSLSFNCYNERFAFFSCFM